MRSLRDVFNNSKSRSWTVTTTVATPGVDTQLPTEKAVRDAVASGGVSGTNIASTAFGSEPGSPAAGHLDLYTNSYYVGRYSGSAWVPWGPIYPFVDPALAALSTWVNQGTASIDTTNGGVYLLAPADASDQIRARVKTAPATPYVITAAVLLHIPNINFCNMGLVFRESGTGEIQCFGAVHNSTVHFSGSLFLTVEKFNSATNYSANYARAVYNISPTLLFLRIADDGVDRICSWSQDGQHWIVIHTVGRTDFLTADQVGFYVNTVNATYSAAMTLLSWQES